MALPVKRTENAGSLVFPTLCGAMSKKPHNQHGECKNAHYSKSFLLDSGPMSFCAHPCIPRVKSHRATTVKSIDGSPKIRSNSAFRRQT